MKVLRRAFSRRMSLPLTTSDYRVTTHPRVGNNAVNNDNSNISLRFRYRLMIEFDGTSYYGWARQPLVTGRRGVHEALADAAARFAVRQSDFHFYAAGRTDSGVHALACVAHVDFDSHHDAETVLMALNSFLRRNGDVICIVHAEEVAPSFHARFDALQRRYIYLIQQRSVASLNRDRAWHLGNRLKVEDMDCASQFLIGTKDFSIFRSAHCASVRGPVRTISAISVKEIPGGQIMLNVQAPSFFMHQVRSIVGCLAVIGSGKWSVSEFQERVQSCDRKLCAPVAPAQGLYFAGVLYPDFNSDNHRSLLFGEVGF